MVWSIWLCNIDPNLNKRWSTWYAQSTTLPLTIGIIGLLVEPGNVTELGFLNLVADSFGDLGASEHGAESRADLRLSFP